MKALQDSGGLLKNSKKHPDRDRVGRHQSKTSG